MRLKFAENHLSIDWRLVEFRWTKRQFLTSGKNHKALLLKTLVDSMKKLLFADAILTSVSLVHCAIQYPVRTTSLMHQPLILPFKLRLKTTLIDFLATFVFCYFLKESKNKLNALLFICLYNICFIFFEIPLQA